MTKPAIIAFYLLAVFMVIFVYTLFAAFGADFGDFSVIKCIENALAMLVFVIPLSIWILFFALKDYKAALWCLNYAISVALSAIIYTFLIDYSGFGLLDSTKIIPWEYDEITKETNLAYFKTYKLVLLFSVILSVLPPFFLLNLVLMFVVYVAWLVMKIILKSTYPQK